MLKIIILFLLRFYKKYLSSGLGTQCRFTPTCSEYTYRAVNKYGTITGLTLGLKRILRCHPWSKGGEDPP